MGGQAPGCMAKAIDHGDSGDQGDSANQGNSPDDDNNTTNHNGPEDDSHARDNDNFEDKNEAREDGNQRPIFDGTFGGGWDVHQEDFGGHVNALYTVNSSRVDSLGDDNSLLQLAIHAPQESIHVAGIPTADNTQEGPSVCVPLGELPTNFVIYPFGYHIPHPLSTVSHTRVWLPDSFPQEGGSRKKARQIPKLGACGQHARFPCRRDNI